MDPLKQLSAMQAAVGPRATPGLDHALLKDFLAADPDLARAIGEGHAAAAELRAAYPELVKLPEEALLDKLQAGFVNFYAEDQRNPYVPVAGRGPWLVTLHGAVLHDSGGYGMIGFGHAPDTVIAAMTKPHVMANIMTPSFAQHRLFERLRQEIGSTRQGGMPYGRFICMNSGSEAMTVATRISDIHAKTMTDPGARYAGRRLMYLTLKGGFHGRTERPAKLSNSSLKAYQANLASFRNLDVTKVVEPNDVGALEAAFAWAEKENVFFESVFMEPVMGEGDPGKGLSPAFYKRARELSTQHGSLLVMDSIQAGIRAHGCLSVTDYPGFGDLPPPDMESFSKAVNAGQYPLSILAMTESAAKIYVRGVYGNTKTTNPRALEVAVAVLDMLTPQVKANIVARGKEFLEKFEALQKEFPAVIRKVQGTGLLCSVDIDPARFAVVGKGQLEEWLRRNGIGVIHGGTNALRYTPHFRITSKEVDLVVSMLAKALREGPKK
jgi:acetylornithine/succinyldiaminopimelate/putrescine aminotransferase